MAVNGQRITLEALKRGVPRQWATLIGNEDWEALEVFDQLDLEFVGLEKEVKKAQRGHKNDVMGILARMLALMSILADKCHTQSALEQLGKQLGLTGNGSGFMLDTDFDNFVETKEDPE